MRITMANRKKYAALREIRSWNTEDVVKVLQRNDLGVYTAAFLRRDIDGDNLLNLTEGKLALWKKDIGLQDIRRLTAFIKRLTDSPELFVQPDVSSPVTALRQALEARAKALHTDNESPLSDSGSWDTDFEEDVDAETSKPALPIPPTPKLNIFPPIHSVMSSLDPAVIQALDTQFFDDSVYESFDNENLPSRDAISAMLAHAAASTISIKAPEPSNSIMKPSHYSPNPPRKTSESPHLKTKPLNHPSESSCRTPAHLASDRARYTPPPSIHKPEPPCNTPETLRNRSAAVNQSSGLPHHTSEAPHLISTDSRDKERDASEGYCSDTYESIPSSCMVEEYLCPVLPAAVVPPPRPAKQAYRPPLREPPPPPLKPAVSDPSIVPGDADKPKLPPPITPVKPTLDHGGTLRGNQQRPLPPTPSDTSTASAPLETMPWFRSINRHQAQQLLSGAADGTFLIRPSTQPQNPVSLSLYYSGRVYHIAVRKRLDSRFALGTEKEHEQTFSSVETLVANYCKEDLILYSGGRMTGKTRLRETVVP